MDKAKRDVPHHHGNDHSGRLVQGVAATITKNPFSSIGASARILYRYVYARGKEA
jgi:hypothetical protein